MVPFRLFAIHKPLTVTRIRASLRDRFFKLTVKRKGQLVLGTGNKFYVQILEELRGRGELLLIVGGGMWLGSPIGDQNG